MRGVKADRFLMGLEEESGDSAVWGCSEALNIGLAMCGGRTAIFSVFPEGGGVGHVVINS